METTILYIFYAVGFILSSYLGFKSFNKQWTTITDTPTYPRYLTSQRLYATGIIGYALMTGMLFILVIVYWAPLKPLISMALGNIGVPTTEIGNPTAEKTLTPILAVALVIFLLGWESAYNPLRIIRQAFYDFVAIPRKAYEVHTALRNSNLLKKFNDQREDIITALGVADSLNLGDFEKNKNTIEYRWANICMLFFEMNGYAKDKSYRSFFGDRELKWRDIQKQHSKLSESVAKWKKKSTHYTESIDLLNQLEKLESHLYWLLTFLHFYGSNSADALKEKIDQYGSDSEEVKLVKPCQKIALIGMGVGAATLIGHEMGVFVCRTLDYTVDGMLPPLFGMEALVWLAYAMAGIWLPTAIVIVARCRMFRVMPVGKGEYWGFYIITFISVFLFSVLAFILVDLMFVYFDSQAQTDSLVNYIKTFSRWGMFPALIASFCAYCIDHNCKFLVEKINRISILSSLKTAVIFSMSASVIGIFATADFVIAKRVIIVATLFFLLATVPFLLSFKMSGQTK